jgi:hypothetical protein
MVAVSLTNEWTSTHVAFLEWLSISRGARAGRYELLNGNPSIQPIHSGTSGGGLQRIPRHHRAAIRLC